MKKVILTGANGFIGKQAIQYLEKLNYEIHCVTTKKIENCGHNVTWHRVDLLNDDECMSIFKSLKPTHLLHFAWYTEPGVYWSSEKNTDWLRSSLKMLQYFSQYGGKRATFAGTCAEYDWSSGICTEYVTPIKPKTLYGNCKSRLRSEATEFCSNNNISFSWGRIFFLYGPYENPLRLVPSVILSLLKNSEAKCTHGMQLRDFLYSEDVASAFVELLDSGIEGDVNIGSGTPISIKEIVNKISIKVYRHDLVTFGAIPVPPDDPPLIVADIKRLKNEVGWEPKYSLDKGLDKTIEWWKQKILGE